MKKLIIPRLWKDRENILTAVAVEVNLSSELEVMIIAPTISQLNAALDHLQVQPRNKVELVVVMPHHVFYADRPLYKNRPHERFGITETGGTAMKRNDLGENVGSQANTIVLVRGFTYNVIGLRGATLYTGTDKTAAIEAARKFHTDQNRTGIIKMRRIGSISRVPVPPGVVMVDFMSSKMLTIRDLADRTNIPYLHLCQIIAGKAPITESDASMLAFVFENSALFWNDLQKHYEENMRDLIESSKEEEEEHK